MSYLASDLQRGFFFWIQGRISKWPNKIIDWLSSFCSLIYIGGIGIIGGGKRSNCSGLNRGHSGNIAKGQTSLRLRRKKSWDCIRKLDLHICSHCVTSNNVLNFLCLSFLLFKMGEKDRAAWRLKEIIHEKWLIHTVLGTLGTLTVSYFIVFLYLELTQNESVSTFFFPCLTC